MKAQHSPEPWAFEYDNDGNGHYSEWYNLIDGNNETIGCKIYLQPSYYGESAYNEEQTANAQHMVDCVNACFGINPKAVPKLLDLIQAALELREIEEQTGDVVNWPKWFEEAKRAVEEATKEV